MEAALWRAPAKVSGPDGTVKTSRLAHPRLATQAAQVPTHRQLGVPTRSSCPQHGPWVTQLRLFSHGFPLA